jgi:hypothetical protein
MTTDRIRSVEVPDDEQGTLISLVRLADPALDVLDSALCEAAPTLDRQELIARLRREPLLAEVSDLDEIVSSLVNVVGTAYSGRISIELLAQAVVEAIQNDHIVDLSETDARILLSRLVRLGKSPCLEVIAKANLLSRDNERSFRSAQIVSDFRPVYSGEDLHVAGGLIMHTLSFRSIHNGRAETLYITMDSADLLTMREVITRAIRKDGVLREFLANSKTQILTPASDE